MISVSVSGGAARHPVYQEVLHRVMSATKSISTFREPLAQLPDNLRTNLQPHEFWERLNVAYGLASGRLDETAIELLPTQAYQPSDVHIPPGYRTLAPDISLLQTGADLDLLSDLLRAFLPNT